MTTLITFLGRSPKNEGGYRTTTYQFDDGEQSRPVAFFGWALQERIRPRRLVVLGTAGSMWDHLFEVDFNLGGQAEDERLALADAVDSQQVEQRQLDLMAPLLESALGCQVMLRLIPYCRDTHEQIDLLRILDEEVHDKERINLDVTHGFRHLPMLALVSALHLERVKNARVEHIWYGSYDPDTASAPVLDLSGLLRIVDWLEALAIQDHSGDYGVFSGLLEQAGLSAEGARQLRQAAYFENILNVGEATGRLKKLLPELDRSGRLAPEAELMRPILRARIDWAAQGKQFEKQLTLAKAALKRGDYLRAVLYAYESVITRLCLEANVSLTDFDGRETLRKNYEIWLKGNPELQREYRLLKDLRNQIAHGSRGSRGEVQKALLSESVMRETLHGLLSRIENGDLPGPFRS